MKYKIIQRMINPLFKATKSEDCVLAEFNNYYICCLYRYFYCFTWEPGPRANFSVSIEENIC
jgi:hypothetical protein